MFKLKSMVLAAVVVAAPMAAAQAQMPAQQQLMRGPDDMGSAPMGHGPTQGRPGMGMMMPMPPLDERLAIAKDELQITDDQMPQWQALSDAFHEGAAKVRAAAGQGGDQGATRTAMTEIDRRVAVLEATLAAARDIQAAAQPLYDALSDKQKQIADEMLTKRRRDM